MLAMLYIFGSDDSCDKSMVKAGWEGHPISPSELGSLPDANERIIHFPRQFSMTSTFHGMSRASAKIGCNYILIDNIYIYIYSTYILSRFESHICVNHTIDFLAAFTARI